MSSPKQAWCSLAVDVPSAVASSIPTPTPSRSRSVSRSSSSRSPSRSPARLQEQDPTKLSVKSPTRSPQSLARVTPKQDAAPSMSLPPPLALSVAGEVSPHLTPIVNANTIGTRQPTNSWFANMLRKKKEEVPTVTTVALGPDTYQTMLRQEYQPENDAIPFNEFPTMRTQHDIMIYDYASQIDGIVTYGDKYNYYQYQTQPSNVEPPKPERTIDTESTVPSPQREHDRPQHVQRRDPSPSLSRSRQETSSRSRSHKGSHEPRSHSRSRSHKGTPDHSHSRSRSSKGSRDRSSSHKASHDDHRATYQVRTNASSLQPPKLVAVGLSTSPKSAWAQTDISPEAPPVTLHPRGGQMDTKKRRVVKVVFPTSYKASTTTTPSTSQPPSNISSPVGSNMTSPMSSAPVSPRKRGTGYRRASVASVDGEMNDYYDEVFDDVFASDEDEYDDDLIASDIADMDITDDPHVEWENENFALAEAKAHQVLQLKKLQQERELQEHRQEEYQPATIWLEPTPAAM